MGNTLTAQQQKDVASADAVVDTIGTEYERLAQGVGRAARQPAPSTRTSCSTLHHTLIDLQAPIPGLEQRLAAAQRRKDKKDVPAAQKALDDAKAALAGKMTEVKPAARGAVQALDDRPRQGHRRHPRRRPSRCSAGGRSRRCSRTSA